MKKLFVIVWFLSSVVALAQIEFSAKTAKPTVALNERFQINFEMNEDGDHFTPPDFSEFRVLAGLVVTIFILVGVRSSRSISMSEIAIRKALILAVGFIIIAAPIVAVENSVSSSIVVGVIWVVIFSSATVLVVKGAAVTLKNAFIRVISLAFHIAWEALVTTLCIVLINFHLNFFNSDL